MAQSEQKRCRICAEQIAQDAILCKHCRSYQNWRRHFQFSNVVLTLLVALVAVTTPLVNAFRELAKSQRGPSFAITLADAEIRTVHLAIENVGDRSGFVSDGIVTINGKVLTLAKATSGPTLVPAHRTVLISYILMEPDFEYSDRRTNDRCEIRLIASSEGPAANTAVIPCNLLQKIENSDSSVAN